jgi:hypothetical protein
MSLSNLLFSMAARDRGHSLLRFYDRERFCGRARKTSVVDYGEMRRPA